MAAGTRITIWIAILLTLAACSKESADVQLPDKEAKSVTVHLTLSMRSTSGSKPTEGVGHENFIAADDVETLLYEKRTEDSDDYYFRSRAFMAGVTNISDGKYTLTGVFDRLTTADEGKSFRLVVLANLRGACKVAFPYDLIEGESSSTLEDLYERLIFDYPDASSAAFTGNVLTGGDESDRIPMWGVGTLTVPQGENTQSTEIVRIDMLRALAKVRVKLKLDENITKDYTLTHVSLMHCNERGMLTPAKADTMDVTPTLNDNNQYNFGINLPSDPGTLLSTAVTFHKESEGVFTLYCPELAERTPTTTETKEEAQSETDGHEDYQVAHMHVRLRHSQGDEVEYPLYFANTNEGSGKLISYPVLRNHFYNITITGVEEGELSYTVNEWTEHEGDIEFE